MENTFHAGFLLVQRNGNLRKLYFSDRPEQRHPTVGWWRRFDTVEKKIRSLMEEWSRTQGTVNRTHRGRRLPHKLQGGVLQYSSDKLLGSFVEKNESGFTTHIWRIPPIGKPVIACYSDREQVLEDGTICFAREWIFKN